MIKAVVLCILIAHVMSTPLDDYVNKFDSSYNWTLVASYPSDTTGLPYSSFLLNLTSQTWKTELETNQPLWWHYLIVVIPNELVHVDSAFLMIDNGRMTDSVPTPSTDSRFNSTADYALGTKSVSADLKMVPNQALHCQNDEDDRWRSEDDLIAWTWRRFLDDPNDPEILLQLPMTKAAVKAMNAITEFTASINTGLNISSFMLSGGSKRGWTTYLAAAVDQRVFAIVPSVLSCLNFVPVMRHQYRAYGGWSFSQVDYYRENITADVDNPNMQLMMNIIDPYIYRSRLTMPKLIIMASGDEHFMPDDSWYFFNSLPDPKYMWWLENSGHSIGSSQHGSRVRPNTIAFYNAVKTGYKLPTISWQRQENSDGGLITLLTDTQPVEITSVYGDTNGQDRRDFRVRIGIPDPTQPVPNPITWTEQPLLAESAGVYKAVYTFAEVGWRCFAIKMTFAGPDGLPLYLTTEANIIPDTFPYADCIDNECRGSLL